MIGEKEAIRKNRDVSRIFIVVGSNYNSPCYNTQAGKMSG